MLQYIPSVPSTNTDRPEQRKRKPKETCVPKPVQVDSTELIGPDAEDVCVPTTSVTVAPAAGLDAEDVCVPTTSVTVASAANDKPIASTSSGNTCTRPHPRRSKRTKFVGRKISHKWVLSESTQKVCWYSGTVLDVVQGCDGDANAVYDILYDVEKASYEVDHLPEDFARGWVKFIDV
jgi:hypothetical protein